MMRRYRILSIAALLCISSTTLFAQLPSGITKGATVEGITEYNLSNGMRVLLLPDNSAAKLTVNVTYLVGSRNEGYGEKGMAHLLEHMMFRGTPKNPDGKVLLTNHGAEFNGSTWYDRTNYFEIMPAADTTLKWALTYEADRMVNSSIAKDQFDKEMTVVRNEFEEDENQPQRILTERVLESAYQWHNYGFPTVGPKSDIEHVPVDRLHVFYAKWYQPDNAVLVIAGKFDVANALKYVAASFGKIPKPKRILDAPYTTEPPQDGEHSVTMRRTGDVFDVCAAYHIPCAMDTDAQAIEMLMDIIGDGTWGRLYHALVETKLASSVYAYTYGLKEPGVALAFAETQHGDSIDVIRDLFLKAIESVGATGVTDDEVSRARAKQNKQYDLVAASSSDLGIELSEWAAKGDWRLFFVARDRLKTITAADIKRVAAAYLKSSNRTLGVFIPTKIPDRAIVPAPPDVAAIVGAYKSARSVEEGETFDATPENIDARTVTKKLPVGVKLALLSKKTRNAKVTGEISFRFGTEELLTGKNISGDVAGDMLMRGTKHHTREQIQSMLDTMQAIVLIGGSNGLVSGQFETTREHLAPTLALIAEILREPAFDEKEFGLCIEEKITGLESVKSQPQQLGFDEFSRRLHPFPKSDIRYIPTIDERIAGVKTVTLAEVRGYYTSFYGASNGECAIVGDFDPDAVTRQLTDLFNGWNSPTPFTHIKQYFKNADTASADISAPDKSGALVVGGENINMRDDNPDYAALTIGNYLFGGAELSSRLSLRIRDKEGLSYGVGTFLQAPAEDSVTAFGVYGICNPDSSAKFVVSMRDELARTLKGGFEKDELEKGRSGWLQARKAARATDNSLCGGLLRNLHNGRTFKFQAAFEKRVEALRADEVIAAMRKYVEPSKMFVIRVGDFSKSGTEGK